MKSAKVVQRTCILVLGMHRSGTSAMAGVLSKLGVDTPATPMINHSMNQKGFFESQKIWQMHNRLLSSAKSSWSDWRPVSSGWLNSARALEYRKNALQLIEQEFDKSPLFVLKDPRICRLLPFWLSVLDEANIAPAAIIIHRNPREVAMSLQLRDHFEPSYTNLLWMRHTLEAEAYSRNITRCFVSFSQLLNEWPEVLEKAQKSLDLRWPQFSQRVRDDIDLFLTPDLKHHNIDLSPQDDINSPKALLDAFNVFQGWCKLEESALDRSKLDAIRIGLDSAGERLTMLSEVHNATVMRRKRCNFSQDAEHAPDLRHCSTSQRIQVGLGDTANLKLENEKAAKLMTAILKEAEDQIDLAASQVEEIFALKSRVVKLDEEIERCTIEAHSQEIRANRLELDIEELERNCKKIIEEQRAERVALRSEIERNSRLTSQLNNVIAERERLKACLQAEEIARQKVYASSSWRVTAPLRWVSLRLKRR